MTNLRQSKVQPIPEAFEEVKNIRCIVANDDPFQLMACVSNLKRFNIEIIQAVNGFEAVNNVKRAICQHKDIHFVLLDLTMPILDGYEACAQINRIYDDIQIFD